MEIKFRYGLRSWLGVGGNFVTLLIKPPGLVSLLIKSPGHGKDSSAVTIT